VKNKIKGCYACLTAHRFQRSRKTSFTKTAQHNKDYFFITIDTAKTLAHGELRQQQCKWRRLPV